MSTEIERISQDPESMRLLQQERLILEVTELICQTIKDRGIRRADLAKALGRTRGRISQLLDGTENLTLRTVADAFTAMGKMVCVRAKDIAIVEQPWEAVEISSSQYSAAVTRPRWASIGEGTPISIESDKIAA